MICCRGRLIQVRLAQRERTPLRALRKPVTFNRFELNRILNPSTDAWSADGVVARRRHRLSDRNRAVFSVFRRASKCRSTSREDPRLARNAGRLYVISAKRLILPSGHELDRVLLGDHRSCGGVESS